MKHPKRPTPTGALLHITPRASFDLRTALAHARDVAKSLDGFPVGGWREHLSIIAAVRAENMRETHDVLSYASALAALASEYADAARLLAIAGADTPDTITAVRSHTRHARRLADAAAGVLRALAP